MSCAEMIERVSAYHDGELSDPERRAVEEHLAGCEACRRRLADYDALDAALRALPDVAASPAFARRLGGRVRGRGRVFPLFDLKTLSLAAAAVVLLTVGVMVRSGLFHPSAPAARPDLPNLDLLVDEEYLGIGAFDLDLGVAPEVSLSTLDSTGKEE